MQATKLASGGKIPDAMNVPLGEDVQVVRRELENGEVEIGFKRRPSQ